MSSQQRVSLCMIVRDEAHNLAACLKPLQGCVDEIIVVDTGSTDATRDIARAYGAKVIDFPWVDDFAAARNESMRHATGDYILWVDADDRFDAENRDRLAVLLRSLDGARVTYMMEVKSIQHGLRAEVSTAHARLFPRLPELHWRYRIHEQILPCLQALKCEVIFTAIQIRHVGYEDAARVAIKAQRDLRLCKLDVDNLPNDPVALRNLGQTYLRCGDYSNALLYFLQSLNNVKRCGDWVKVLFCELASVLCSLGRNEDACAIASQGLTNFPNDCDLLIDRAHIRLELGDIGGAERDFQTALTARSQERLAFVRTHDQARLEARCGLALAYVAQSRFRDAEEIYQNVLADDSSNFDAWVEMAELYIRWGRLHQAEFAIQQVEKLPPGRPFAELLRAEVSLAKGAFPAAIDRIRAVLRSAPDLLGARALLIKVTYHAQQYDDCRAACEELIKLVPHQAWAKSVLADIDRLQGALVSHAKIGAVGVVYG